MKPNVFLMIGITRNRPKRKENGKELEPASPDAISNESAKLDPRKLDHREIAMKRAIRDRSRGAKLDRIERTERWCSVRKVTTYIVGR